MLRASENSHLQHPFRQAGLLRELLEILGVRVLIYREVILHGSQLMVLEAGAHTLRTLALVHRARRAHGRVVRGQ